MPFANAYNRSVADKVTQNNKRDIAIKEKMYNDPASFTEPHSQQEYASVEHKVVGGSGNLAATSYDMGMEAKKVGGAVKVRKERAIRLQKALEGKGKPMMLSAQPTPPVGEGEAVPVKQPRKRKAKTTVEGGDMGDVLKTVGDVIHTGAKVASAAAEVAPYVLPLVGLGKSKKSVAHLSEWNALVKKVKEETGKTLKETLKYIKDNNLYKKKEKPSSTETTKPKRTRKKKEQGGSASFPLIAEDVAARAGDMAPETRVTGNVQSFKTQGMKAPGVKGGGRKTTKK